MQRNARLAICSYNIDHVTPTSAAADAITGKLGDIKMSEYLRAAGFDWMLARYPDLRVRARDERCRHDKMGCRSRFQSITIFARQQGRAGRHRPPTRSSVFNRSGS